MTRSEYTQHADPAVQRRSGMRKIQLPAGVEPLHIAVGKIDGDDVLLAFTSDGLYSVRDGKAEKVSDLTRIGAHMSQTKIQSSDCGRRWVDGAIEEKGTARRSTDRDYRPLWIALVGVATALALLATFQ